MVSANAYSFYQDMRRSVAARRAFPKRGWETAVDAGDAADLSADFTGVTDSTYFQVICTQTA